MGKTTLCNAMMWLVPVQRCSIRFLAAEFAVLPPHRVASKGFFFTQKTAYEMRIIDWSSDVCSSDLMSPCVQQSLFLVRQARRSHRNGAPLDCDLDRRQPDTARCRRKNDQIAADQPAGGDKATVGRQERRDRKSVV